MRTTLILYIFLGVALILPAPVLASTGGTSGLPWESGLKVLFDSMTGFVPFTISCLGIGSVAVAFVFGADYSAFTQKMLWVVLGISVMLGAPSVITTITGKGALIVGM